MDPQSDAPSTASKTIISQLLRFASVGVINTAVGLGTIWSLMLLGVHPVTANAVGYGLGLVVSFVLNRSWTFQSTVGYWAAVRFLCAFAVAYSANLLTLTVGLSISDASPYILQLFGMVTYSAVLFILCRIFVFATPK